jgi:hypothetical protein
LYRLWAYIVGRSDGDGDGFISPKEHNKMLSEIKGTSTRVESDFPIPIVQPKRPTESGWRQSMLQAGLDEPAHSSLFWSSSNGYAYLANETTSAWGTGKWPDFSANATNEAPFCLLPRSCFSDPTQNISSTALFKHIAFEERQCGDCLIAALLGHHSDGLEAFLPPSLLSHANQTSPIPAAALPLTKTWQETDFSLKSVVPHSLSPRQFAVSLLQRYSYTLGDTSYKFLSMRSGKMVPIAVKPIQTFENAASDGPILLALNDDLTSFVEEANTALRSWFSESFPRKGFWEV